MEDHLAIELRGVFRGDDSPFLPHGQNLSGQARRNITSPTIEMRAFVGITKVDRSRNSLLAIEIVIATHAL